MGGELVKSREKRRRRQLRKARRWQPSTEELDKAIAGAKLILRETHKDPYTTEGAWDWLYRQLKAWEKARAGRSL